MSEASKQIVAPSEPAASSFSKDDFMAVAWRDFIDWAYRHASMRAAFEADTGCKFPSPPKNAMEAMIDKATGVDMMITEKFVRWATEVHWGLDEAPEAYRKALDAAAGSNAAQHKEDASDK